MARRRRLRRNRLLDLLVLAILVVAAVYVANLFPQRELNGTATVIDGDSLRLEKDEIRLHGIDAPEGRQICTDRGGNPYRCGQKAAATLRRLVSGGPVTCAVVTTDRYDRFVSRCTAGVISLNLEMVKSGWAVTYLGHSSELTSAETDARRAKRGLWQGLFDRPSDWRHSQAAAANAVGSPAGSD